MHSIYVVLTPNVRVAGNLILRRGKKAILEIMSECLRGIALCLYSKFISPSHLGDTENSQVLFSSFTNLS